VSGNGEPRPFGFTPLAYFDSATAEWVDPATDKIEWPGDDSVSPGGIDEGIRGRQEPDGARQRPRLLAVEGERRGLEVMTARAVCDLPDPPVSDELLGPVIVRRHRTVLGAHTGEGKTSMGLQMVGAVTTGSEFLGWQGRGKVRALVVDAEQGTRSLKRRLREARLESSEAVDVVRVPDGLALDRDEHDIRDVAELLAAGSYAVVLLDPLYKLHSGDSNAERAAVDLMRRFDAWRDDFGFALILPVHLRKPIPGERFSIHDVFGSSAYTRGAEVVLGLRRVSNGFAELHFFKDREGDLGVGAKWRLLFDREWGFRRAPEDELDNAEQLAQRLLEFVRENPGLSTNKVTAEVKGRKEKLNRILHSDDRFSSRPEGRADLWFEAREVRRVPGDGTQAEPLFRAEDDRTGPRRVTPPVGGRPTGTVAPAVGPEERDL